MILSFLSFFSIQNLQEKRNCKIKQVSTDFKANSKFIRETVVTLQKFEIVL
jgi:hypothetical protein